MPTVKRKASGAVVIKDGKVACTCCAQPAECCMYFAQGLADGLYSAADLPDAITALCLTGETGELVFNKSGSSYFASGNYPWKYEIWLDPANNALWLFYRFEDGEWRPIQVEGQGPCLIFDQENCGVKDQFANSYTITMYELGHLSPVVVTRANLCTYIGLDTCGNEVVLAYQTNVQTDPPYGPRWFVGYTTYADNCELLASGTGRKFSYENGGDGINTPVGNYYDFIDKPPIAVVS